MGVPQVQQATQLSHGALPVALPFLQANYTPQVTLPLGMPRVQPAQAVQFGTTSLNISGLIVLVPLMEPTVPT
ncbi:uncharacterized protein G2W53_026262 [Senna tora]|uniref:Uncharacterized protein n=1 Tax=Senna tora TaxID=362788 RepID=A0A834WFI2_9FABA|nr:uncharacterized protein G2W53_026262 [Senna tora]